MLKNGESTYMTKKKDCDVQTKNKRFPGTTGLYYDDDDCKSTSVILIGCVYQKNNPNGFKKTHQCIII